MDDITNFQARENPSGILTRELVQLYHHLMSFEGIYRFIEDEDEDRLSELRRIKSPYGKNTPYILFDAQIIPPQGDHTIQNYFDNDYVLITQKRGDGNLNLASILRKNKGGMQKNNKWITKKIKGR